MIEVMNSSITARQTINKRYEKWSFSVCQDCNVLQLIVLKKEQKNASGHTFQKVLNFWI